MDIYGTKPYSMPFGYYDFVAGDTVPDPPASGWREFLVDTGTTPNRRIYRGIIYSDGTIVPYFDFTS